ncbi:hypothetical protein ACT6QH_08360 [Xanthobacter sp. TB0139]|uniref:hypothetical protein n=1 Tax=Xanthobacter sp. TB0139 TaxID=3459178 RepID=UPI0040396ABE
MSTPSFRARPEAGQLHRRDISARQDLLGRELRQLFEGYTQEAVPDELLRLAEQLEQAFSGETPEGERPAERGASANAREDEVARRKSAF